MSNSQSDSRVFVVLGMHRGGTSASMRALVSLGVDVGRDLLAPIADQNPRGFFEDEPLVRLCDAALEALGMRWDSPRLIPQDSWSSPRLTELALEATSSLRKRFADIPDWGFKNPRAPRLLPFWKSVFEHAGRQPAYLLVLRNPLSVSASLARRNGMSPRRAHLLWLLHMTESVLHTQGERRLCMDYDRLVADPLGQLQRVAAGLQLPAPKATAPELRAFTQDFLTRDLQSSRFEASDLELDASLSSLAMSAYTLLSRWSQDDPELSPAKLQRDFRQIYRRLEALAPVIEDLFETDRARLQLRTTLEAERAELDRARSASEAQSHELARIGGEFRQRSLELELTRQQLAALEARTTGQETDIRGQLRENTLLEARVAALDLELTRARASLDDAQRSLEADQLRLEEAGRQREEAESRARHQTERSTELEGLLQEQASQIAALRSAHDQLQSAHAEQQAAIDLAARRRIAESERESEILSQRVAELEAANDDSMRELGEQRRQREAGEQTLEALLGATEEQARATAARLQFQASRLSGQLVDALEALAATRQWRLARSLQRGVSRLRRRAWIDGMAQLQTLARALHAEAQRDPLDLRHLAALAAEVRQTFRLLSSGELFGVSRRVTGLRYALRLRRRPEGPLELVRNRVGELEFHFQHLSALQPLVPPPTGLRGRPAEAAPDGPPAESAAVVAPTVDVVIPVYKAREATLRCIESVLDSGNRTPHEIIVIDDASGDARLERRLAEWAAEGRITLLRNERNSGFPATANRGMMLHADRDVVLLNSDTRVHGDWLDRLRRSAYADWRVATATPLSNNAEICSYPALCRADAMPGAELLAELDSAAAGANASLTVTLPTAVGFCMYVRREALREVGLFDVDRFGRGYGEENDFCLRARALGFRHVLAADVFVAHEGGVSFSDEKQALIEAGLAEIDRLHPGYRAEIQVFLQQDPVRWLRRRLDLERLKLKLGRRPCVLMVTHDKGGGTHRHVIELARHLEDQGTPVLLLQPTLPDRVRLLRPDSPSMENLDFHLQDDFDALIEALRHAAVGHVHFHHLLGLHSIVLGLPAAIGSAYDVTLHDYLVVCPRVHVIDDRGGYCGLPEADACTACVKRNGSEAGFEVDVAHWRTGHLDWLSGARRVFVPSEDTRARLAQHLPRIELTTRPHPESYGESASHRAPSTRRMGRGRVRRVAVIGAIGPHKGAERLLACALDAAERDLPLEFHLIGYSDRDPDLLETKKVVISGAYREEELESLLRRARCELAFIPSVWPETFCYTLSAAFRSRIHPVAFDLGAVAERIETVGWGELIPLDASASSVNDRLLSIDPPPFPSESAHERLGARYDDFTIDYYGGLPPETMR